MVKVSDKVFNAYRAYSDCRDIMSEPESIADDLIVGEYELTGGELEEVKEIYNIGGFYESGANK